MTESTLWPSRKLDADFGAKIVTMMARKADIDERNKQAGTNLVSHQFWLVDAVELLLRIELERGA